MKINPSIFKSYDIRGKYPKEINKEFAYLLGYAIVIFAKKKRKTENVDIIVGRDNRKSSRPLFEALAAGIQEAGGKIISLGLCTTPMFYFASGFYRVDEGGIMITASHLSKDHNGFKLIEEIPLSIDKESGLSEIREIMQKKKFKKQRKIGKMAEEDIFKKYVDHVTQDLECVRPLKIVIDTGNGVTGILIPKIFKNTNCKVFHIFKELDGNFPNRSLNCTQKNHLGAARTAIKNKKADLGVAFDGDGDRIVFLDERGRFIPASIISAFIASIILRDNPREKILYTVNQSRIIPETVEKNGGSAVISKVGHSNIKRRMRSMNIIFGSEESAHYYHRSADFSEAPFFAFFKILNEISQTGKKLSELIKPFEKYFYSGEVNLNVDDKKEVLEELKRRFSQGGEISEIDGLRMDFKDWWFNARVSHTEPILRLVVEAKTKDLMLKKKKEIIKVIRSGRLN